MEQLLDPNELWRIFRRRILLILVVVTVVTGLGLLVAVVLPPSYVSTARILVESQQIPRDLATSTVTSTAAERIEVIEERLMTRDNLLDLARRLDLFRGEKDMSPGAIVGKLRGSTSLQRVSIGGRGSRRVLAFTLSYRDSDPARAARIAGEMVTIVLEQNARARSSRASETVQFFEGEVRRLEDELASVEAEITAFKRANEGALPDSLSFRREELLSLRERAFDLKNKAVSLEEERANLEEAIASGAVGNIAGRELTPQEQKLQSLERELVELSGIYAERHPRIRSLESRIEATRDAIRSGGSPEDGAGEPARPNPAERRLELLDSELKLTREEIARAEARIEELAASIEATPDVTMRLNRLERRYASLRSQLQSAQAKEAVATTGEKLEVNRQAERFEVIEPARVPDSPESPNRTMIAAGGLGGSLALAIGLAILLELIGKTVRTSADLERQMQLKPMASIPYIYTNGEQRNRRWKRRLIVLTMLVVLPLALAAIHEFFMPVDLLVRKVLDKTGLPGFIYLVEQRFGL